MNPKDIMTDAIHNFHPQYQQYTQYSSGTYSLPFSKMSVLINIAFEVFYYLFDLIDIFSYSMM